MARGVVAIVDDNLVTAYSAFDSRVRSVDVVDVFTPVQDDAFRNTTFLRSAPQVNWRIIARDVWRRVK